MLIILGADGGQCLQSLLMPTLLRSLHTLACRLRGAKEDVFRFKERTLVTECSD